MFSFISYNSVRLLQHKIWKKCLMEANEKDLTLHMTTNHFFVWLLL